MSERGRSAWYLIITRLVDSLRPSTFKAKAGRFVDSDYLGNKYYEVPADPSRGKRLSRRYFESSIEELTDQEVPPEWQAWLRRLRTEPPTREEIDYNLAIAMKKKEKDKKSEPTVTIHPKSTFPVYPEYENSPGVKK